MDSMKTKFKKILHPSASTSKSKKNPYTNPNHPNHNPQAAPITWTENSAFRSHSQPPATPSTQRGRPASPRGSYDFLAEAREAVGRDRVTGRRHVQGQSATSLNAGLEEAEEEERESRTAYQERNHGVRQRSGTRYDLFVQEMKERKEGGMREPTGGYYAPPPVRPIGEFYAPAASGR
ncbi:hypothetical protein BDV96DRAFT_214018 [Lophiotrema nucula]|uniref:Uncharacterized protein n=1 Tax=Lophiotrema nucula TaxID=690887 RepID=A0A6A5ZP82_9PLEO|nr:hypothetical protein BDV96DRAFT_214018 [Lophiotrema nucula]